jgi:acetyltransferase
MRREAQSEDAVAGLHHVGTQADRGKWPRCAKTHDGVEYRIRPIRADDIERDRSFINNLSSSSRYNRMMGLMREPSAELLNHLVHVDYRHEMALVALVGEGADESIIAVARYGGNPAYCEFAVAVADEWQSRGIGTTLSQLLFEYAKSHGVRRMYAVLLTENARMLKLADDLQMRVRRSAHDNAVVEAWRTL